MADAVTSTMLKLFERYRVPDGAMMGLFQVGEGSFFDTEKVELDVVSGGQRIAVPVSTISSNPNMAALTSYVNREMIPPIFKEATPLKTDDELMRLAGTTGFGTQEFQVRATKRAAQELGQSINAIKRSINLMAAQVLQTGAITLADKNGANRYVIDFGMKATHLIDSALPWDDPTTSKPYDDLVAMDNAVRGDTDSGVTEYIFGGTSAANFLASEANHTLFDVRRFFPGELLGPRAPKDGMVFMGTANVNGRSCELWMYDSQYESPVDRSKTPYLGATKVIGINRNARRDLVFGNIPRFAAPDTRVLKYLEPRMRVGNIDFHQYAYINQDATSLVVEAGARPLTIPSDLDSFACLETEPA